MSFKWQLLFEVITTYLILYHQNDHFNAPIGGLFFTLTQQSLSKDLVALKYVK